MTCFSNIASHCTGFKVKNNGSWGNLSYLSLSNHPLLVRRRTMTDPKQTACGQDYERVQCSKRDDSTIPFCIIDDDRDGRILRVRGGTGSKNFNVTRSTGSNEERGCHCVFSARLLFIIAVTKETGECFKGRPVSVEILCFEEIKLLYILE